ncbi:MULTISPECIES: AAA family ATPase [unclassified Phormidium]
MLMGPPGSGKTTLAHKMQQAITGSCIVSTDQIRKDLYGDEAIQGQWSDVEAVIQEQVQDALGLGQSIIYDATNVKRVWRMALLNKLSYPDITWIGWYLTTPLATCQQWNTRRNRAVPDHVIEEMHNALQQFSPLPAEGFAAIYTINPTSNLDEIQSKLSNLSRSITNRANRTRHNDIQLHRYSSLLAFDRLMHLISLLVQYPGLGCLQKHDPEQLSALLGGKHCSFSESLDEICSVLAHQQGNLYADPVKIAQDLDWLEENGLLSPVPTEAELTLPPSVEEAVNPHSYTDWEAFNRVLTTIRFIAHHPFCWLPEHSSSLKSLISAMQKKGLLIGDRQAALRKDIEQVMKPFGILPRFRMRRGYFIGSGVLSERELLRVAGLLQSQVKNIQDPAALAILETLQDRLHRSQHDLADLYPVRAICNRTIINPDLLPTSAIAKDPDRLESEIETGQLLELKRFAGVGLFDGQPDGFFYVWPLQIVFHNIAWYLAYEIAEGPEVGLLQFERLDRLFRGRPQSHQRDLAAQQQSLHRLQQLYQACSSLYLGMNAKAQKQFLSRNPEVRAAASMQLELWFTDKIFAFVSEGTQRFPMAQMRMSPKLTGNPSKSSALFTLPKSSDPLYPNRLQVQLPSWSRDDRDLQRWILGFGAMVKVVAPLEIAAQIHKVGCAIAELYASPETLM